ncbi:hypothetical protein CEP54_004686 [Fusarium duplospermum]|uniref:Serine carboxypeptidase n=1 Tax=Fusarium duplospermum TaxID=1325734 RepID=A0A428QGZ9_9HYPO|nr:hypothetical protein CEP54_004686 [Fusarium duplospermum]
MWLSSYLFTTIIWLIVVNAQKYDPEDKYAKPFQPLAHITDRHNTCGQKGLVSDYSGYIAIAMQREPKAKIPLQGETPINESANMFFWFFEARHRPQEAPVVLFLNGGPGISSVYRVFDGSGPCLIDWKGTIRPNPHSLNEYANVLYVDQPVGAGFSYGNANFTDNLMAADYLYAFMQHFYFEFPYFRESEFGIWTSDWGATAGLALAQKILNKNIGLKGSNETVDGELPIKLTMMGMESPKIDPPSQLAHMYMYMTKNPWLRVQWIDDGAMALEEYMQKLEPKLMRCGARKKYNCKKELRAYRRALRSLTTPDDLRTEFDLWDLRDARHGSDRSRNIGMKHTPGAKWLNDPKNQEYLGVTGGKLARGPIKFEPWNIDVLKPFSETQESDHQVLEIESQKRRTRKERRKRKDKNDDDLITNPVGLKWISQNITVGSNRTFETQPLVWDSFSFNSERHSRQLTLGEYITTKTFTFVNVKGAGHVIAEHKPKTLVKLFWALVRNKTLEVPVIPWRKDTELFQ